MLKNKIALKIALIIVLIAGGCLGTVINYNNFYSADINETEQTNIVDIEDIDENNKELNKRINLLLLGVDARPGWATSRSDTMVLASVDPDLQKVALISIPRDTMMEIEGRGKDKICTANFVGGPELAVSTVEKLIGIDIEYYAEVDFNGFVDVVDTLGGVEVDVPQRMYKPKANIDLQPGFQKLNGKDALAFVRYRDYPRGDIERNSKQQEFLAAFADELFKPANILKISKLSKQFAQYVNTNLKINDMLKLVSFAQKLDSESIFTQTLPGYFYDERDSGGRLLCSYWKADEEQLPGLLDDVFAAKEITVIKGTLQVSVVSQEDELLNEQKEQHNIQEKVDLDLEQQTVQDQTLEEPVLDEDLDETAEGNMLINQKDMDESVEDETEPDGKQVDNTNFSEKINEEQDLENKILSEQENADPQILIPDENDDQIVNYNKGNPLEEF